MKPKVLLVACMIAAAGVMNFRPVANEAHAALAPIQVFVAGSGEPANGLFRTTTNGTPKMVVSQKDKTFLPASINLKVGETVEIANDDGTVHNAYCQSGSFRYNSGPQQPGTSSRVTFTAPGTYEVRCAIHPKMKLFVTVTE